MTNLFGTDGIRGEAGKFPLDQFTVSRIGFALSKHFAERLGRTPKFVSGMDTRESGPEIEAALFAGISAGGGQIISAGLITTPGVAFLTAAKGLDAGIVISASHNPHHDNGIKIFLPDGRKSDRELEKFIEAYIEGSGNGESFLHEPGNAVHDNELASDYLNSLSDRYVDLDLSGKKMILDCANGAASDLAPKLFASLGAEVIALNNAPNGRNINENCGSLHLEGLQQAVVAHNADIGLAFDGDADRVLMVDESGKVVDGDGLLWVIANEFDRLGVFEDRTVVSTVMSNIGLELALEKINARLVRTSVGDKYVLDKLLELGAEVGGEQSGHIIVPRFGLVGDGMLTGLIVLSAMTSVHATLSELTRGFVSYPQVLINIRVKRKPPFNEVTVIQSAVEAVEEKMNGSGRLLLRYSGTENLARVMIEGKDQLQIEEWANDLAHVIETQLS